MKTTSNHPNSQMAEKLILTLLCLVVSLSAVKAATPVLYWDPEGASTPTAANLAGTWDGSSSQWSTTSAQTATPSAWGSGDAACFCAGSTTVSGGFTVSVNSTLSCAGIFNGPLNPPGFNVTIGGTGSINFVTGTDALDTGGSDGDPLIMTVPITGPGIAVIEGDDQLYLKVANSYTGGTYLGYTANAFSSIVNFTNGSFGTGSITFSNASGGAMVVLGTAVVTVSNPVTNVQSGALNFNVVGNAAGVTFDGPWNFTGGPAANGQVSLSSGGAPNFLNTISGKIAGTNGFNKYGVGMLELTGANTYGHAGTTLGSTWISNGWLVVANSSGSATGVSSVIITNSASPAGTGTLTGSGTISGSVTNYGNISATNMAGGCATLTTGAETWKPGSAYIWTVNNISGSAGVASGWNLLKVAGNLTISSTFTIDVTSLTAANKQGALATFNNAGNYTWLILTNTSGSISGFNAANVTIDTSAFGNALGSGKFTVSSTGNALYLNFLQPPTVTVSPGVFSVASSGKAIINANATGTQLTYAWQLNGGALTGDAAGQGTANLTISPARDADAGTYTVTVSNPDGSVSANSLLVVVDPPVFSGTPGSGNFTMNYSGPVGRSYRIWSSPDFTLPFPSAWTLAQFSTTFSAGVNTFTDSNATDADEYYCITVP